MNFEPLPETNRGQMHIAEFITERKYLRNVSEKTLAWYSQSFKAFDAAMESKASIATRCV